MIFYNREEEYFMLNILLSNGFRIIYCFFSNVLILVDSGGSVFEVHEKATSKRNIRCIFTGCKGEVVFFRKVI